MSIISVLLIDNDILLHLFSSWLEIDALAVLDSSFCNQTSREKFLDILLDPNFVQKTILKPTSTLYFTWLDIRKIRVTRLALPSKCSEFSRDVFQRVLKNTKILHHMDISSDCSYFIGGGEHRVESLTFIDHVHFDGVDIADCADELETALKSFDGDVVTSLDVLELDPGGDSTWISVSKLFPNLTTFIPGPESVELEAIFALITNCPKLTNLSIGSLLYRGVSSETCLNSLREIIKLTPNLTSINMSGTFEPWPDKAIEIVATNYPNIQKLELCQSLATDQQISIITRYCKNLRYLDVSGDGRRCKSSVADASLKCIANSCPLLTELHISHQRDLTDDGIAAILHHCPLLEVLHFSNCHQLTDVSILAVAKHCTRVRVINLAGCDNVNSSSLLHMVENCSNICEITTSKQCDEVATLLAVDMRSITLNVFGDKIGWNSKLLRDVRNSRFTLLDSESNTIDINALYSMAVRCPLLTDLIVTGYVLNDSLMLSVIKLCPQLRKLTLSGLFKGHKCLNDEFISSLANICTELRVFDVSCISALSDASAVKLVQQNPKLRVLSFHAADGLSDATLTAIATHCTQLQSFSIVDGILLTDAGVTQVLSACKNIARLSFISCGQLTSVTTDYISENVPCLEKLVFRCW